MAGIVKNRPARTIADAWRESAAQGNNFDALRFLAAALVIFSHAFEVTDGSRAGEPLWRLSGAQFTLGELGVMMFFAMSGFLIAQSWRRTPRPALFFANRGLRILPALVAVVAVLAFVIGPLFSNHSFAEYFAARDLRLFLLNAVFIADFQHLPGVFEALPQAGVVDAPLWTLFFEAACYALLAALGMARLLTPRACLAAIAVGFALAAMATSEQGIAYYASRFGVLGPWFFAGAAMALWAERIPLDGRLAAAAALCLMLTVRFGGFDQAFALFGVYLTLYAGFAPLGRLSRFGAPGDFSYGLYLWGWPVQQIVVATIGPSSWAVNFALAFPLALLAAVASWRLIEGPALAQKRAVRAWLAEKTLPREDARGSERTH